MHCKRWEGRKKKEDRKRTTRSLDAAREKTNQKRRISIITRRRERNVQTRRGIAVEDASSTKRKPRGNHQERRKCKRSKGGQRKKRIDGILDIGKEWKNRKKYNKE